MTIAFQIIYDDNLSPSAIATSAIFTRGLFLAFDTANLPLDEGIEIGFVLTIKIPVIGRVIEKDIALPSFEFQKVLNSFSVIEIPREYSDSGYQMQCGFHSSESVENFRVYVVYSDATLDTIAEKLKEIEQKLGDVVINNTNLDNSVYPLLSAELQANSNNELLGVIL
jgi:hypothetical protein